MNTEFGRQGLNCTWQQRETILWLAHPWLCTNMRTKDWWHIRENNNIIVVCFFLVYNILFVNQEAQFKPTGSSVFQNDIPPGQL